MKKRLTFLLALAMIFSLALTACGGNADSSTPAPASTAEAAPAATDGEEDETPATSGDDIVLSFTWWGSQSRHDYTQELLDLYSELNPGITFETTPSDWDGYFDKLSVSAAGGTMPDIIQMDYLYIATYAGNGTLADMYPYIENGILDVSNIDETIYSSGDIGGILAGIPASQTVLTMGYNPEVLEEAGLEEPTADWTWDDFVEMCLTVKSETGKYGFSTKFEDTNMLLYWVRQYGYELFNEDGTALGFDDPSIVADFWEMWAELIDAGASPNPDEHAQIKSLDHSAQPVPMGDGAFVVNWNNYTSIVAETNTNIGMITPPLKEGGDLGLWVKPGMFLSVAESSQHKDEAMAFVNWFLNSTEANDVIAAERGTPVSSEIRSYLKSSLNEQQIQMFDYVDASLAYAGECPDPDPEGVSEVVDLMVDYGDQVFYGMISPADAAEAFCNDANAVLARNA